MPELPEVETIARQLIASGLEGLTIEALQVDWEKTVAPFSGTEFSTHLCGCTLKHIGRYGKWLMFGLSSGKTVMIHLRMSGSFSFEAGAHDRLCITFEGGRKLYYADPRKFGRWRLVDQPEQIVGTLGPDALTPEFTLAGFQEALSGKTRMIKAVLLDQSIVAGIGNIYADEALWLAKIHPQQPSETLTATECKRLHQAVQQVLQEGVKNRGTSLGDGKSNYRDVEGVAGGNGAEVQAYGRSGKPCHGCGKPLEKITVAQRSTTYCKRCQPLRKIR